MNLFTKQRWSPYLVGALLGMLTWFTFGVAKKSLGVSTNFSQVTKVVETALAPEHAAKVSYFSDYKVPSAFGWEAGIFAGLIFGGFVASWLSGDRSGQATPDLWVKRFGSSPVKSNALAFVAGIILIYGARLAGGCTSGHGISGSLQLAVSSWAFFFSLFASGLATAFLLFRKQAA
ncbi:MAG: YeeE/YedE family protein [Planctomycetaceae bacterium]|nr:YeeE/YedE family protein [Planctomycetaceae bacterium]